ncbi:MAG: hypothetical protein PHC70_01755 [Patescibacteria group bacterium]|nr:hypothetical protein [Patescibacteria group bacterium]
MAIHRDLQMVHVNGGDHEVRCAKCKKPTNSSQNETLTRLYFDEPLWALPFFLLAAPVAAIHEKLTGRPGRFKHPPEHKGFNF